MLDVRPCGEETTEAAAYRLAVRVEIEAKPGADVAPVFASPAGATLVKDGKIFRPAREATPGCGALLQPKNLAPGERTRGILVFSVPHVAYARSAVLRFKPPRWGFESTVSVKLPDCFGAECPGAPIAERIDP
jgi:hypothetical protein